MADINDDLAAAIAKALSGSGMDLGTEEPEQESESPEMSDSFFDKLAAYERKINE